MAHKNQPSLFEPLHRLEKLSKKGDPLEKLERVIPWQDFSPILKRATEHSPKGPGGRPPYDVVQMFKVLVLQRLYNPGRMGEQRPLFRPRPAFRTSRSNFKSTTE